MTNQAISPDIPLIRSVIPSKGAPRLRINWQAGGHDAIDFTGMIALRPRFKHLADPALFEAVTVIAGGAGIAWDDQCDLSGSTLKRLANAQRPMGAAEFRTFQSANNISNATTAVLIDRGITMVKEYRAGSRDIPPTVATVVRHLAEDPIIFAAHYRPPGRAGRPRKRA